MGYGCRNNCVAQEEGSWRKHHHHHRRPCEDCFDPLVLMYIDDNQCSLEDDVEADADWENKWWDAEGWEEHDHHHHHHHDPCHACHHPHILMYIDDNLCDDADVAADYGWEWCIIEDEFGRRRWHKRRTCCSPRVLMAIDEDPCLLAEAEAARDKEHWYREED